MDVDAQSHVLVFRSAKENAEAAEAEARFAKAKQSAADLEKEQDAQGEVAEMADFALREGHR